MGLQHPQSRRPCHPQSHGSLPGHAMDHPSGRDMPKLTHQADHCQELTTTSPRELTVKGGFAMEPGSRKNVHRDEDPRTQVGLRTAHHNQQRSCFRSQPSVVRSFQPRAIAEAPRKQLKPMHQLSFVGGDSQLAIINKPLGPKTNEFIAILEPS